MESSRASFSSYSRSSFFSSPASNGTSQPEPLSFDQSSSSSQFGRQSLDLPNEVKDSSYRKDWRLPVKTTTKVETAESAVLKNENSPRPQQLYKSVDESFGVKFQEASSRTSCASQDGSFSSVQKDAPRFSYEGSDLSRLSFESRDSFKSSRKLKELPRLSLDSRVGSLSSPTYDSKSDFVTRKPQTDGARPPSVVAKLMGLETLPASVLARDSHLGFIKTCQVEHCDPFPRSLKSTDLCQSIRTSTSLRNPWKESGSRENPKSVKKLISRLPIEAAPWKLLGGSSHKPDVKHLEKLGRATPSFPSAYIEIEERLKDLELSQSGKDLRALEQLIDAIRAKGFLDNRREEQDLNSAVQKDYEPRYRSPHVSAGSVNKQKPHSERVNSFTNKGGNSLRTFDPKIVIIKPAKLVEILASSVTPMDCLSSLPKLHGEHGDSRKSKVNNRSSKKQIQKNGNAVSSGQTKFTSTLSPQLLKENTIGLVSPRLQQKKLELDKRCWPLIAPDSRKPRKQPNNQLPDLGSPGGKCRPKSANILQIDYQSSDISTETRNLGYQQNDCCMRSGGSVVMGSVINADVPNLDRCAESNGRQSPSMKNAKYSASRLVKKKLGPALSEDGDLAEFASVASEHSSPVSILDDTMFKVDALSPVKQMRGVLKGDGTMNSNNNSSRKQPDSAENLVTYRMSYSHNLQMRRKKLESIEHLVKKLRQLNSNHDETQTDYIASLCETSNPDHRYISEILLASGFVIPASLIYIEITFLS